MGDTVLYGDRLTRRGGLTALVSLGVCVGVCVLGWATPSGVALSAPSGVELSAPSGVELSREVQRASPLDEVLARALHLHPEARLSTWSDVGRLDWSALRLEVTGVGAPLLLSPTGGLATQELGELARRDAQRRLAKGLTALNAQLVSSSEPHAGRRLGCGAEELIERSLQRAHLQRFSDGSVHLSGALNLRESACPKPRARGGVTLSFARLRGSPIQRLEQLPRISAAGGPLDVGQVRFFHDHEQARSMITGALQAKARTLSKGAEPGAFVLQGPRLGPDEELWVFISVKGSPSAEASP